MSVFGIMSDTHNHNWHSFSQTTPDGINSRLEIILDETKRLAQEVKRRGGSTIYHCGDLFHVRGSVAPSVLNPTLQVYQEIINEGIDIRILAGNHDLESKTSKDISSAISAMGYIYDETNPSYCTVTNDSRLFYDDKVAMIAWYENIAELLNKIEQVKQSLIEEKEKPHQWTLMCHAPIDGVIYGLPEHGLTAQQLADFGFKNVFCGHYHNHKDLGQGVYSVGALTQNSWSDIGSKAGFVIVDEGNVIWYESQAPKFVEITPDFDKKHLKDFVEGNYVRARVSLEHSSEINKLRSFLTNKCGAKGVQIISVRTAPTVRQSEIKVTAGDPVEKSVRDYIRTTGTDRYKELQNLCSEILTEANQQQVSE